MASKKDNNIKKTNKKQDSTNKKQNNTNKKQNNTNKKQDDINKISKKEISNNKVEESIKKIQKKVKKTNKEKELISKSTTKDINSKLVDIKVIDNEIKNKLAKLDNNMDSSINTEKKINKDLNFSLFEVILLMIITILTCILI